MTKVMVMRPHILRDAINMATRFDDDFAHSQKVHRKKRLLLAPTKFKKELSMFKGPQKLLHRSLGRMRPPQS